MYGQHYASDLPMGTNQRAVVVNDLMQTGYVYYITEPMGQNFHPGFEPELNAKTNA